MQTDKEGAHTLSKTALSAPELTVVARIAEGLSDNEIAHQLGLSTFIVRKHVASILRKLNAASRTEAAIRAMKDGLIA